MSASSILQSHGTPEPTDVTALLLAWSAGDGAALDPDQARLVELRYFAGLTMAETAEALGVSRATANRHWATASVWLRRELEDAES